MAENRRKGSDRRRISDRRRRQELFNSGDEKHMDRRVGQRRKGPRRKNDEDW